MDVIVDATVGGADSNSYITVEEADQYFGNAFGKSAWGSASGDDKARLVITSSRYLDQYLDWYGEKSNPEQAMDWPRSGVYSGSSIVDSSTIPNRVRYAACELAYHLLQNGDLSFGNQTIDSVKLGSMNVAFSAGGTDPGLPANIESLLQSLGTPTFIGATIARSVNVVRS